MKYLKRRNFRFWDLEMTWLSFLGWYPRYSHGFPRNAVYELGSRFSLRFCPHLWFSYLHVLYVVDTYSWVLTKKKKNKRYIFLGLWELTPDWSGEHKTSFHSCCFPTLDLEIFTCLQFQFISSIRARPWLKKKKKNFRISLDVEGLGSLYITHPSVYGWRIDSVGD